MKPMETRVRVGPGAETKHGLTTEYAEGVYLDTGTDGRVIVLLDVPQVDDSYATWRAVLGMEPGMDYKAGLIAFADPSSVVEILPH